MAKIVSDEITISLKGAAEILRGVIAHNLRVGDEIAKAGASHRLHEETIVPYLKGSPGTGKTSAVEQVATQMDCAYSSFIPAQYDPAELAGFLFLDQKKLETIRMQPTFLPTSGRHVILADEFGQAGVMQKNVLAQLIQERRLDNHHLSPHATLILAGNRQADRAGVSADPTHVVDRVMVINIDVTVDDWKAWALRNNIRPEIIAYLHMRPSYFNSFDPAASKNCTARGWAKVSTILNMQLGSSLTTKARELIELTAVAGQIGSAAATDFYGFLRVARDLPDPDEVIANPDTAKLPDISNANAQYALAGAISARTTHKNAAAVLKVVRRMPAEIGAVIIQDAMQRDPTLQKNPAFTSWKIKEGAALYVFN